VPSTNTASALTAWEFVKRVSEIENTDPPGAVHHARIVVDFTHSVVLESDFHQLRNQLSESEDDENWRKLFEIADAGSWSDAHEPNRWRTTTG